MHFRRRRKLHLLSAGLAIAAWSLPAAGYHTRATPITDETANTHSAGRIRLGPFKAEYGVFDTFMLGTYVLPWVALAPNLYGKWKFFEKGDWSVSTALGGLTLDLSRLEPLEENFATATITLGRFEPTVSWRLSERFTWSSSTPYSEVAVRGEIDPEAFEGALQGAIDNFQLTQTLEWRATSVTALVVHGRASLSGRASAAGRFKLAPDKYTSIEARGAVSTRNIKPFEALSLVTSVALSFQHFNLRVGAGYGNWNIAPFNFQLPKKTPIVDLDVYWLF